MDIFLIIFAAIFILFLPGFVLSLVFFKWGKIDIIERIALSFALSIAVVPLLVFYTNLIGIKITRESVILETLFIIAVSGVIYYIRRHQGDS